MDKVKVPILLEENVTAPEYMTEGASGADVRANITEEMVIQPGDSAKVPTGLRFAIPQNFEIQVRPRSGLALKHQISIPNTPGTIDADYRGELAVILINHGKEPFTVLPKMRVAQIVLAPVVQAEFIVQEELVATNRGSGGFGHSGTL